MFSFSDYPNASREALCLFKTKKWEYENEWRSIIFSNVNKAGFTVNDIKMNKIILGSNIPFNNSSNTEYTELLEKLLQIGKDNNVPIFRMRPQQYSYKLDQYKI